MVSGKNLNVVFVMFLATPSDIGLLLVGNHLGWQHISIVIGTANVDWISIGIMTGVNGEWRQILIYVCGNPGVICNICNILFHISLLL